MTKPILDVIRFKNLKEALKPLTDDMADPPAEKYEYITEETCVCGNTVWELHNLELFEGLPEKSVYLCSKCGKIQMQHSTKVE